MNYEEQFNRNRIDWLYGLARSDVSPSAVKVGLLFATFVQPEKRELVRPGYAWLMANAHVSRPTLARALKELEAKGYLVIERFNSYRSEYSLPFDGEAGWKPSVKKTD